MVNNSLWDYVKSELGRSITPYDGDSPLDDAEARELFEDLSYDTDLEYFDALILHGGEKDDSRYDIFEKAAFHLQASGKNPKMFVPEQYRQDIESSEVIHADTVEYFDAADSETELSQIYERFNGTGRVQITSDTEAMDLEDTSIAFDEDDFVILSADTSGERIKDR